MTLLVLVLSYRNASAEIRFLKVKTDSSGGSEFLAGRVLFSEKIVAMQ